jgi:hypothetical protein
MRNNQSSGSRGRNNVERDEEGRFMSYGRDYDDGRNYDDRSTHSGSSRGRNDVERDEEGRFMGQGRGRSSGHNGSSPGHGGWFGDSQGHSEAARQGWNGRH